MFPYFYAHQKFSEAIYCLAVGGGDVRSRLLVVFNGPLYPIFEEHLPKEHHGEWLWVRKEIVKFEELYSNQRANWEKLHRTVPFEPPARLEATMKRITNRTGRKIAEKIHQIWYALDSMYQDWRPNDRGIDITANRSKSN